MSRRHPKGKQHKSRQAHTPSAPEKIEVRGPRIVEEAKSNDNQNASDKEQQPRLTPIKKGWTSYKWATIIIQAVTLIALIIYTAVNYGMLQAIKATNRLTQQSNANTLRLGLANLRMMESSNNTTQAGINETRKQSAASQAIAQHNLELARQQFLESRQAKVFIAGISVDLDKDPVPVAGEFYNVGTLAADDFAWNVAYTTNSKKVIPLKLMKLANPLIPGIVQPFSGLISLPPGAGEAIKKGEVPLWLLVRIRYTDSLSRSVRMTTACFAYNSKFANVENCERQGSLPSVTIEETP